MRRHGLFLVSLILLGTLFYAPARAEVKQFRANGQACEVGWGTDKQHGFVLRNYNIHFYRQDRLPDGRFASRRLASIPVQAFGLNVGVAKNFLGRGSDAVVLIASMGGSGMFVDFSIFTVQNGQLVNLFQQKNLYQGRVVIKGRVIEEYNGGQKVLWAWNGKAVQQIQAAPERQSPGVHVVKCILEGDTFTLSQQSVTLKPGQKVRLVMVGPKASFKFLLNENGVLTWDGPPNQLKTVGSGQTFVDIVRSDGGGGQKLTVTVGGGSNARNGKVVQKVPAAPEKQSAGVHVVKYFLRQGVVHTNPYQLFLKVGERMKLQPAGNVKVRILYNGDGVLQPDGPVLYKAAKPGTTFFDIIPNGYDWEGAKKLMVVVN